MNELQPDDKTICSFRKDNPKALKETFREFATGCRELELGAIIFEIFCGNPLTK
jgi:hypothetical protein